MEKLTFISPSMDWERELLAYKEAFGGEHLHGGSRLQEIDDLSEWLNHLEKAGSASTCGEGRSPSTTFLCIRERDQTMVGICNIRHDLNQDYLMTIAGHIGYSIHPAERRKGYATEQLRLALLEAKNWVSTASWSLRPTGTLAPKRPFWPMAVSWKIPTMMKRMTSSCCATGFKMIKPSWSPNSVFFIDFVYEYEPFHHRKNTPFRKCSHC